MSTTPDETSLAPEHQQTLLSVARDSVAHGLQTGRALTIDAQQYPPPLQPLRATFVTLNLHNQLRGCIGMLEAQRPLIEDVAQNAFAAAFRDPRFTPVSIAELVHLEIHISILSPPQPLSVSSEQDLLEKMRPGIDGLILQDKHYRGTFLPAVWESLPDKAIFLAQLKRKVGMPDGYWSDTIQVMRYTATSVP